MKQNPLKTYRESQLLSKMELARKANVSPITISRIEKGKPWRNLMETHFSIEYRLLDSYLERCIDLKEIQRQHERFMEEYNCSAVRRSRRASSVTGIIKHIQRMVESTIRVHKPSWVRPKVKLLHHRN